MEMVGQPVQLRPQRLQLAPHLDRQAEHLGLPVRTVTGPAASRAMATSR
ncbi:hypothetical protein [Nonomuraea sp. NPDC048901]